MPKRQGGRKMKKEDLKAGYVLVFEDGRKRILLPVMYNDKETLIMVDEPSDCTGQQIYSYDPFTDSRVSVVEVWGMSDDVGQMLTTNLEYRKLLWKKEKPIKVTGDEKVILANLPNGYTYIARDEDGRLFVYDREPELVYDVYRGDGWIKIDCITKLKFDVIKPLTCHKISDLL